MAFGTAFDYRTWEEVLECHGDISGLRLSHQVDVGHAKFWMPRAAGGGRRSPGAIPS